MVYNKMDKYFKDITKDILLRGTKDRDPRPKYKDGTRAYTKSINHIIMQFDLANGEFPLLTLRPVSLKSAIGESIFLTSLALSIETFAGKY